MLLSVLRSMASKDGAAFEEILRTAFAAADADNSGTLTGASASSFAETGRLRTRTVEMQHTWRSAPTGSADLSKQSACKDAAVQR